MHTNAFRESGGCQGQRHLYMYHRQLCKRKLLGYCYRLSDVLPSPNSYVEILTPSISPECIWRWVFKDIIKVK